MEETLTTTSSEETIQLGNKLSSILKQGDVIALFGDLAAGKTTLIKGICQGMEVEERVDSPTYTLINEYKGKLPIYHIDCYREENTKGWVDIGIEEYFYGDGITLVEWAEKIEDLLPQDHIEISIEQDFSRNKWRKFNFKFPEEHERNINILKD